MTRRMSCSMTVDAVKARTKTVTRRHVDTWRDLKPGDHLALIEKGMGLPKGAKQVVLAEVEVTQNHLILLFEDINDQECAREGFPEMTPGEFIGFWLDAHRVPPFRSHAEAHAYEVRRIKWRYLP